MRNSNSYAIDGREWIGSARSVGGRSLIVTIPAAIVETMRLRPGAKVRLHIERFKAKVEEDEEEAQKDGADERRGL